MWEGSHGLDVEIETVLKALYSRNLNGIFAETVEVAKAEILKLIRRDAVVGVGDSTTARQLGIIEQLEQRGTRVLNGFDRRTVYTSIKDWERREEIVKMSTICDVFLTGTNTITLDGRLVNVDGGGGRVAGMFWGHPTSIIVAGKNKIVRNLDEAFHRLRKVIAPNHIRIRAVELGGLRFETPCVATGECNDCRVKDRACNIFTVIEGKPLRTTINVIIVGEDLGLSWDESWPRERIAKIKENYKRFVWTAPADLAKWRKLRDS
jgi:hypothetical protein